VRVGRFGVGDGQREQAADGSPSRSGCCTPACQGRSAIKKPNYTIKLVAWGSGGMLRPAPEDFAMLRLILLALLPQIGGVLLMVARNSRPGPGRRGNAGILR
jgi:hypothetical protein